MTDEAACRMSATTCAEYVVDWFKERAEGLEVEDEAFDTTVQVEIEAQAAEQYLASLEPMP